MVILSPYRQILENDFTCSGPSDRPREGYAPWQGATLGNSINQQSERRTRLWLSHWRRITTKKKTNTHNLIERSGTSPMNSKAPPPETDFGKDLKTFEQLPAKTRELVLLKDQAEKTTGKESAAVNKLIRDRSK